ncbi:MAG: NADH-quinone oxidoreductase subunit M [Methylomonas sp.]|nr:NADH-quinone oxidoreductase subunit M [Methylomonas sp.]
MNNLPLLSLCLFWPAAGAMLLTLIRDQELAKRAALTISGLELVLTLLVVQVFDPALPDFQLLERHVWIAGLNVHYRLGVDGISVLFLPMTALLTMMAILAGWNSVSHSRRFHLLLLLLLESITIGVFCALDLVLFFLFWELTLPPLFFLIGLWGMGAERRYAAMKYTLYMLFGGVPLLFGFILLALNHAAPLEAGGATGSLSFSLPELLNAPPAPEAQGLIFLLLLLGFAVKSPLPPFHVWLPTVAMEAPAQITALLTGLKLGLYGIIRFAIPLAPAAAYEQRWLLATLGAVTLLYAGLIALQQTNLRRLLAYASISHVGLVLLGIASLTLQGLQGAVMQLLNFGIVASSLMLIAGMIQQRLGSTEYAHLGGLARPMPQLTTLFFIFALSSIGVPGTNSFPAEWLIVIGTLKVYPALAAVALFTAMIAAAYVLNFARRGLFGPVVHDSVARLADLRPRELALLGIPAVLVFWGGLYPQGVLKHQEATSTAWRANLHLPLGDLTE